MSLSGPRAFTGCKLDISNAPKILWFSQNGSIILGRFILEAFCFIKSKLNELPMQSFTETFLCARHPSRCWNSVNRREKALLSWRFHSPRGWGARNKQVDKQEKYMLLKKKKTQMTWNDRQWGGSGDSWEMSFSHSVMSDSLQPHGLQDTRLPSPLPSPRVCLNSWPLSWWCHPTISSSVAPFSRCLQSFPALGSFPMSRFFSSGGQSIGASASVLPMNIQGWFPLGGRCLL